MLLSRGMMMWPNNCFRWVARAMSLAHFNWASLAIPSGRWRCSSDGKESTCNAGDLGSIPGSGRSSREGHGNLLQYSCLENPMDRGTWWATVHGVTKSWTKLPLPLPAIPMPLVVLTIPLGWSTLCILAFTRVPWSNSNVSWLKVRKACFLLTLLVLQFCSCCPGLGSGSSGLWGCGLCF